MLRNMKEYEILEHIGDAKIRAFGKTKAELFLNAVSGMTAVLKPKVSSTQGLAASRKVSISSSDINALLVDFLSEVLYLIQINKEVYDKIKFKKFSDTELEAELSGHKVDIFGEDIKAATYHGLDIHQMADGVWQAEILFDI